MWNIFGRYKGKKVLPSARQMNLIAAILNHVTQGTGIAMDTPQQPSTDSPWRISVDVDWLKEFVGGGAGSIAPSSLAGSDAQGNLTALLALLTSAPATAKVLGYAKGASSPSWVNLYPDSAPSSSTTLSTDADAPDATTWTADGTKGVVVKFKTREKWSGTYLWGYYRTATFDECGRLRSISAESRYIIDTPVTYNQ